ncbi:hypothetical protein BC833DRAFT_600445 [Globomyces pollinis-pini]|nr:hypothetical protein BC833DRAFT_600445 [Globomyces pollinis-pini]
MISLSDKEFETFLRICRFIFPCVCFFGISNLFKMVQQPRNYYSKRFNIMLLILSIISTSQAIFHTVYVFIYTSMPNIYVYGMSSWLAFSYALLFLLTDMELLRLLYIISPFFTSSRITMIQIIEVILFFILGGGVLLYPNFIENDFFNVWYNIGTFSLYAMVGIMICSQCLCTSWNIYRFVNLHKTMIVGKPEYWKTIVRISCLGMLCLAQIVIASMALLVDTQSTNYTLVRGLFLRMTCMITPIQSYVYQRIFSSIKKLTFINKNKKLNLSQNIRVMDINRESLVTLSLQDRETIEIDIDYSKPTNQVNGLNVDVDIIGTSNELEPYLDRDGTWAPPIPRNESIPDSIKSRTTIFG